MPEPSAAIRCLTDSIDTMRLTLTLLPTSRKTSSHVIGPIQSRLFTSWASSWLPPKRTMRPIWPAMAAALSRIVASSSICRASVLPDGSPTSPVAPPTSTSGRCPARCRCASPMIGTSDPTCSESAVGSNPQYAVTGVDSRRRIVSGASVHWAINPRSSRVSYRFVTAAGYRTHELAAQNMSTRAEPI